VLGFGRAAGVGLVGVAAALIAASFPDAPLGAELASRGEGRIAFTFGESGADRPSQLAVIDADGKNWRALPPYGLRGLSWSPDGGFIAFGMGFDMYTINVDDIWVLTLNDRRQRRVVRGGRSPSWSPDGRKLAFERGRGERCLPQRCVRRADVWVLEVAAKKERRLVQNGDAANWSPDGRQIAFERWRSHGQDFESSIYVMRADGTAQRRLFKGEHPVWSPNGKELAFVGRDARRGYADAVIRARLDGSGRRVLFGATPYCGCVAPDWGPPPRRGHR
jgi:Tol biopolymer transport system component